MHCAVAAGAAPALALALLAGCGAEFTAPIVGLSPLNGATAVALDSAPGVQLDGSARWAIDAGAPELLLYDVTLGVRQRLGGQIAVEGESATFVPGEPLQPDHDFELVLERTAGGGWPFDGPRLTESEASEWPEEPLAPGAPYRLRFSTRSAPRVRAVYLDRERRQLHVRFSQPMNQLVTAGQFDLVDARQQPVPIGDPVWSGAAGLGVRITIERELDPLEVFTLTVAGDARAADGSLLDGDGDGTAGEPDDAFTVQFTGSQLIVLSRQPSP